MRRRLTERHILLQPLLSGSVFTRVRPFREACCSWAALLQSDLYCLTGCNYLDEFYDRVRGQDMLVGHLSCHY